MLKLPTSKKKIDPPQIDPKDNYVAMDIGTEVLKTVLFNMEASSGVYVKKISRIQQQQHAMSKGVITNLNTVMENCRLAFNELTSDLPETDLPKSAVMGVAGEFIQGVSIIVNYEREEKFEKEVTEKEQNKIIERVHRQITESGKEDLANRTGLLNEDIQILHITITGMEIGGINVASLVGFKGKSVKLYFYASFAPKTYIEALKKVAQSLDMDLLGVVSQPFAVARGFSGSDNKNFSALFIDVGGGTTDIAIVEKGNVVDTQMFAFGGRVFTKEIARELNLDFRHAESRKIKYSSENLDKALAQKVKDVAGPVAETWMKSLKAALEMAQDIDIFPSQVYLCGGGSLLPEIKSVMMEFPWTRLLPFTSVPKIDKFLPKQLGMLVDESGDLKEVFDVTPASLAKFAFDKMSSPENYYLNA